MWHISERSQRIFSNIVCEYEVNLSTNEKVITEKQNFNTNSKRTMLNIKLIWRSRSWCYMLVKRSWP